MDLGGPPTTVTRGKIKNPGVTRIKLVDPDGPPLSLVVSCKLVDPGGSPLSLEVRWWS